MLLVVLAASLPFYLCVVYEDWYVDEVMGIVRNEDAQGDHLIASSN